MSVNNDLKKLLRVMTENMEVDDQYQHYHERHGIKSHVILTVTDDENGAALADRLSGS